MYTDWAHIADDWYQYFGISFSYPSFEKQQTKNYQSSITYPVQHKSLQFSAGGTCSLKQEKLLWKALGKHHKVAIHKWTIFCLTHEKPTQPIALDNMSPKMEGKEFPAGK